VRSGRPAELAAEDPLGWTRFGMSGLGKWAVKGGSVLKVSWSGAKRVPERELGTQNGRKAPKSPVFIGS
jgi:hypothetical protein